jgi:hypothetical protein
MLTSQPAAWRAWSARIVVSLVLVANLSAAIPYLVNPAAYAGAFELSGTPAAAMVRGIGILFLMWNVTYLPVIVDPLRQRTLFVIVLAQQVIGLAGETWILASLSPGHAALAASGLRFVAFDSTGLVLLLAAFLWTRRPAA